MGNMNENNILGICDVKMLEEGIEKIKEFSAKDFAKFSAITAVCFSIVLWVSRSMGYFYLSGRFSIYNIDKSYIDVWSEGFWVQVIQTVSICIGFFVTNYIYYQLSIKKERQKKIGFVLLEFIILVIWIAWENGISIKYLIKEPSVSTIIDMVVFLIGSVLAVIAINSYGIVALNSYNKSTQTSKVGDDDEGKLESKIEEGKNEINNDENETNISEQSNNKKYIHGIMLFLAVCIVEFVCMYIMGRAYERNRSEFKYIIEEVEDVGDDQYLIEIKNEGDSYYVYPIIYENQDVYILSQFFKTGDDWKINSDYLKIIDKTDVSTYHIDNIDVEIK